MGSEQLQIHGIEISLTDKLKAENERRIELSVPQSKWKEIVQAERDRRTLTDSSTEPLFDTSEL